ncbi:hypothetical protein GCM10008910_42270 [Faecalicatena orotica]
MQLQRLHGAGCLHFATDLRKKIPENLLNYIDMVGKKVYNIKHIILIEIVGN